MKQKVEAIDLFCGIGGLSYGLKKSGIDVKAGLDCDVSCKYAYEKNIKSHFIAADISTYNLSQLKKFYSKDSIKVLVGCAPCQPFSSHSHKYKDKSQDKRWDLVQYFAEATEKLKPDIISMENVRGLVKTDIFKQFMNDIKSLGYVVDYDVLFCPDYGIPQNRYRLVLLAGLRKQVSLPQKTCTPNEYLTVADCISEQFPIRSGEMCKSDYMHKAKNLREINLKRIHQSKPGGTWRDWDPKLLPNCYKKASGQTFSSVYGRMSWDKPSPTITTQFFNYGSGRFGHPEQNRALSLREGALLQTFPKDYDFGQITSMTTLGRHIGNAVPPRLGEVIGEKISNNILGDTDYA